MLRSTRNHDEAKLRFSFYVEQAPTISLLISFHKNKNIFLFFSTEGQGNPGVYCIVCSRSLLRQKLQLDLDLESSDCILLLSFVVFREPVNVQEDF
jgi:hypothetical protein